MHSHACDELERYQWDEGKRQQKDREAFAIELLRHTDGTNSEATSSRDGSGGYWLLCNGRRDWAYIQDGIVRTRLSISSMVNPFPWMPKQTPEPEPQWVADVRRKQDG